MFEEICENLEKNHKYKRNRCFAQNSMNKIMNGLKIFVFRFGIPELILKLSFLLCYHNLIACYRSSYFLLTFVSSKFQI
jgi:hypothetical protein